MTDLHASAPPAVRFDDVVKRYRGPHGDIRAVDGVTLDIAAGELVSLLGPNGAGKTTSLEMLVGLRAPTSGTVRTLGVDPVRDRDTIRRRVAVQPQHAALFEQQTVAEILSCWASFYPDAHRPDEVLERLGLVGCRDQRVGKLSGGQQQRVLVALAMVSRPQLLVLDEPSTGMDPNARLEMWGAVGEFRSAGGTVVLSTHSMEEADHLSDRVAILHRGRVAALGTPEALVAEHAPHKEVSCVVPAGWATAVLEPLVDRIVSEPASGGRTRLRLSTRDSDRLLMALGTSDGARDISLRDAGLDGVFRRVTGHDLTDTGAPAGAPTPDTQTAGSEAAPAEPALAGVRGER